MAGMETGIAKYGALKATFLLYHKPHNKSSTSSKYFCKIHKRPSERCIIQKFRP